MLSHLEKIYPITLGFAAEHLRNRLSSLDSEKVPQEIRRMAETDECVAYLPDLARVELALSRIEQLATVDSRPADRLQVNPCLEVVKVNWAPLLALMAGKKVEPLEAEQYLLFWRNPRTAGLHQATADPADLLALKMVIDELDPLLVASQNERPVGEIDRMLERAVRKGLLVKPVSKLRRRSVELDRSLDTREKFLQAEAFTLQWHITHRCDLSCRHCYDRSQRDDVSLSQGLEVLGQMRSFCLKHNVYGQVSFSGGNPFLHPEFLTLYRAAHERNLNLAILGNPVAEEQLNAVMQVERPVFFQVSLEGLQEHNDQIRGTGNFASVLDFLDLLQQKNIYSMVMLTLTQANMHQVLPLAEVLRDRVDLFTFNRLSMVGEGANLESPRQEDYQWFVREYLQAQKQNPVIALKDSLINIEREKQQLGLFGGCTGFGCGAAFNFVSLLPDGQVHACRKFPSLLGDINQQSLEGIYASAQAEAYRRGCRECDGCRVRACCGGCLAVAYGYGLDPLKVKDPACFIDSKTN